MVPTETRSRSLPVKPSAEHLRKQAKDPARGEAIQLAAAQRRLAREYGYRSWSELIRHVQSLSAAYKATREADEATGPTPLEMPRHGMLAHAGGAGTQKLVESGRWRICRSLISLISSVWPTWIFFGKVLISWSSGAVCYAS